MDQEYQKEQFVTLRIKESVAREFRKFCKEEGTSQSVTLAAMLCFFERHHTRPGDNLPISNKTGRATNSKAARCRNRNYQDY